MGSLAASNEEDWQNEEENQDGEQGDGNYEEGEFDEQRDGKKQKKFRKSTKGRKLMRWTRKWLSRPVQT